MHDAKFDLTEILIMSPGRKHIKLRIYAYKSAEIFFDFIMRQAYYKGFQPKRVCWLYHRKYSRQ